MMNRLHRVAAAALSAFALAASARADETRSVEICHFDANGGGCAHFQGYLYLRPGAEAEPSAESRPGADAALGGDRLYIHIDGGLER